MISKSIATLLFLSALGAFSAGVASAQGTGFNGGGGSGLHGHNPHRGGFHGRGFQKRGFGVYGFVDGYGYENDSGPDWYGISSGYDECPLFRQRVMTRDGWRVRMIPIC
jgi:hypothetical protein